MQVAFKCERSMMLRKYRARTTGGKGKERKTTITNERKESELLSCLNPVLFPPAAYY